MSLKVKLQVTLHRKDHDGSTIVRLEPVADPSIPTALRFHTVVELHADSDELLTALRGPTDEKSETFARDVTVNGELKHVLDRRVIYPSQPGSVVVLEITPAS